jgi:hypothetical protein
MKNTGFKTDEREDGWYAIFPNEEEFGPFPTEDDLMFNTMRKMMEGLVQMMSGKYPCPRCGVVVTGQDGYMLEIDGAPVFFCSEICARKRKVFPRKFQKEMM